MIIHYCGRIGVRSKVKTLTISPSVICASVKPRNWRCTVVPGCFRDVGQRQESFLLDRRLGFWLGGWWFIFLLPFCVIIFFLLVVFRTVSFCVAYLPDNYANTWSALWIRSYSCSCVGCRLEMCEHVGSSVDPMFILCYVTRSSRDLSRHIEWTCSGWTFGRKPLDFSLLSLEVCTFVRGGSAVLCWSKALPLPLPSHTRKIWCCGSSGCHWWVHSVGNSIKKWSNMLSKGMDTSEKNDTEKYVMRWLRKQRVKWLENERYWRVEVAALWGDGWWTETWKCSLNWSVII